jgi:hypothetical protein
VASAVAVQYCSGALAMAFAPPGKESAADHRLQGRGTISSSFLCDHKINVVNFKKQSYE